ncbi:MAG: AAC(3) family N-acetyltransferase [Synergistaceae bacterium]|nr:AAC(3) family N-acetyltransferase [Synergistaceae bacterium]
MEYISYKRIVDHLDIERGDSLHISSDIRLIMRSAGKNGEMFDIGELINSFQRKLGTEGTLIFPTFNWDFCKGLPFDYRKTLCMTGSLGQAALRRDDFARTAHPMYSFAVWGKDKDLLCGLRNKSGFGHDSPFAYLNENAKGLMFSLPFSKGFTFNHFVEEISGHVTYRYMKDFTAEYIDDDGKSNVRTYSMFVRDLDLDVKNATWFMASHLKELGVMNSYEVNGSEFHVFKFSETYEPVLRDILYNRSRKICTYIGQNE